MPERIFARYFKPEETLFSEGDTGDNAYIVERGKIEISIDVPSGKKVVAELGRGKIIGEISLIAEAPRSATAIALQDAELLVLTRDRLLKPIEAADPIMRLMIQIIVNRLRDVPRLIQNNDTASLKICKAQQNSFEKVCGLALQRIQIEAEMRQAIEVPELELYYQPIVGLKSGVLVGYEALMRWTHPKWGGWSLLASLFP